MFHIPDVQGKAFLPRDGVASVDLCPAGDAGAYGQAAGLFGGVEVAVVGDEGAWADEAHVACEDVPQFGQFVQAEGAQGGAQAGQAFGIG